MSGKSELFGLEQAHSAVNGKIAPFLEMRFFKFNLLYIYGRYGVLFNFFDFTILRIFFTTIFSETPFLSNN